MVASLYFSFPIYLTSGLHSLMPWSWCGSGIYLVSSSRFFFLVRLPSFAHKSSIDQIPLSIVGLGIFLLHHYWLCIICSCTFWCVPIVSGSNCSSIPSLICAGKMLVFLMMIVRAVVSMCHNLVHCSQCVQKSFCVANSIEVWPGWHEMFNFH